MPQRDYYQVLGVPRDADAAAIRRAYKRGAMKHHPDRNLGDPSSEERFKELGEAHKVLSNPASRAAYDRATKNNLPNGEMTEEFARKVAGMGPIMTPDEVLQRWSQVFGEDAFYGNGGVYQGFQKPVAEPYHMVVNATLEEAAFGFSRPAISNGRQITARFPAGVRDGEILKIQLAEGVYAVRVSIQPHKVFYPQGDDLMVEIEIPAQVAMRGGEVQVPRLGGGRLSFDIAPGALGNRLIRLRGQGMLRRDGNGRGDIICRISSR